MQAEDVRLAQARWLLGKLAPERLVAFAVEALAADLDSPSLRVLAGESRPTRDTVDPLFRRALSELGFGALGEEQARLVVARSHASRIVAGEVPPYDGAKAIWQECDPTRADDPLQVFRSLASEHEDYRFAAESRPGGYDEALRRCEREIVDAARALLAAPDRRSC